MDTISAALAAITPTAGHIAYAQSEGSNPATFLLSLADSVAELVQRLVQFQKTMPADDANISAVNAIIANLA